MQSASEEPVAFDILALALAPLELPEGVIGIDDAEDFELTEKESEQQFGQACSSSDVTAAIANRIPQNTKLSTCWAHSVWKSWSNIRGITQPLQEIPAKELNEFLSRFVLEARRQDDSPYPATSLYQLVCGLQRYLRDNGRPEVVFFDEKQPNFDRARKALDARMKELTSQGVGVAKKCAQPLTSEQENELWEKGIFSIHTAEGLLNAVFWYACKCFGLRGGDEHRSLMREQFSIDIDSVGRHLRFIGRSSKNVQGGLKQRQVQTKGFKIYAKPSLG